MFWDGFQSQRSWHQNAKTSGIFGLYNCHTPLEEPIDAEDLSLQNIGNSTLFGMTRRNCYWHEQLTVPLAWMSPHSCLSRTCGQMQCQHLSYTYVSHIKFSHYNHLHEEKKNLLKRWCMVITSLSVREFKGSYFHFKNPRTEPPFWTLLRNWCIPTLKPYLIS